jgi:hypothetical protein
MALALFREMAIDPRFFDAHGANSHSLYSPVQGRRRQHPPLIFHAARPKGVEGVPIIWKVRIEGLDLRVVAATESAEEQPMAVGAQVIAHARVDLASARRDWLESAAPIDRLHWQQSHCRDSQGYLHRILPLRETPSRILATHRSPNAGYPD